MTYEVRGFYTARLTGHPDGSIPDVTGRLAGDYDTLDDILNETSVRASSLFIDDLRSFPRARVEVTRLLLDVIPRRGSS